MCKMWLIDARTIDRATCLLGYWGSLGRIVVLLSLIVSGWVVDREIPVLRHCSSLALRARGGLCVAATQWRSVTS